MKEVPETSDLLKQKGLKATPQRIAVYDAMRALGHASADDVRQSIGSAGQIDITVATVYNVLQSLTEAGLLHRRLSANNKMYYDITMKDHCHIYDEATHTITDFNDSGLTEIVNDYIRKKKINNFDLNYVDIQLMGRFRKTK